MPARFWKRAAQPLPLVELFRLAPQLIFLRLFEISRGFCARLRAGPCCEAGLELRRPLGRGSGRRRSPGRALAPRAAPGAGGPRSPPRAPARASPRRSSHFLLSLLAPPRSLESGACRLEPWPRGFPRSPPLAPLGSRLSLSDAASARGSLQSAARAREGSEEPRRRPPSAAPRAATRRPCSARQLAPLTLSTSGGGASARARGQLAQPERVPRQAPRGPAARRVSCGALWGEAGGRSPGRALAAGRSRGWRPALPLARQPGPRRGGAATFSSLLAPPRSPESGACRLEPGPRLPSLSPLAPLGSRLSLSAQQAALSAKPARAAEARGAPAPPASRGAARGNPPPLLGRGSFALDPSSTSGGGASARARGQLAQPRAGAPSRRRGGASRAQGRALEARLLEVSHFCFKSPGKARAAATRLARAEPLRARAGERATARALGPRQAARLPAAG